MKCLKCGYDLDEETVTVTFERINSWPKKITKNTLPERVETIVVPISKTFIKNGKRFYKLVTGHGTDIVLETD